MMYSVLLAACCLVAISSAAIVPAGKTQSEIIQDAEGNEYYLNITEHDDEEDLDLTDTDGNHIVTVEVFQKQGYKIDKPASENVCLLVQVLQEEEQPHDCYTRETIDTSILDKEVLDHCEGREIYVLVPADDGCEEAKQMSTSGTETTQQPNGLSRSKRWLRCYTYAYLSLEYRYTSYCCRRFFIFCTGYCKRWSWTLVLKYVIRCY